MNVPLPAFLEGPALGSEVWEFQDHCRDLKRLEWGLRKSLPNLAWLPALRWLQGVAEVKAERLAMARGNPHRYKFGEIIPDNAFENEGQPSGPIVLSAEQLVEFRQWAAQMAEMLAKGRS